MFFGAMDTAMKAVTIDIGVIAALFWRCMIGSVIAGALFLAKRQPPLAGRRGAAGCTLLRGTVVSAMAVLFFWGLARTPMAETVAITFIAPIIALFLAAVLLKERIGRGAVLASVLGFGGVLVITGGRLGLLGGAVADEGLRNGRGSPPSPHRQCSMPGTSCCSASRRRSPARRKSCWCRT